MLVTSRRTDASPSPASAGPRLICTRVPGGLYAIPATLHAVNLCFVDSGTAVVRRGDDDTRIEAGQIVLWDARRPSTVVAAVGARALHCLLPRDLVDADLARLIRDRTQRRIRLGAAATLPTYVLRGILHAADEPHELDERSATHLVGLVRIAVEDAISLETRSGLTVVAEAMSFIEERIGDPDLATARVAAALNISTRTLCRAFQREGVTVSSWIRTRRLDLARQDLQSPLLRGHSIAAIAARRGILDPAHFSHSFKDRFGVSPLAMRKSMADAPPAG